MTGLIDGLCSPLILSVSTGEKRQLTFPTAGVLGDSCASVSPDGKALGFRRANAAGQWRGSDYVLALDSEFQPRGKPRQVPPQKVLRLGVRYVDRGQPEAGLSLRSWALDSTGFY
jgi:hypothetical protein